jgi:hypothetical protein
VQLAHQPKFNVGIVGLEGEKKTETESQEVIDTHRLDVVFTNVVRELCNQQLAKHGVLIVVDEFDRIEDPAGFASFLKSLATNVPKVKFCLVGVAQDIKDLMKEHESTDRLFAGSIVKLPPMTEAELADIVRNAENAIGGAIIFDDAATRRLVSLAQGHPYMIHLVGKYALRNAFESNSGVPDTDSLHRRRAGGHAEREPGSDDKEYGHEPDQERARDAVLWQRLQFSK